MLHGILTRKSLNSNLRKFIIKFENIFRKTKLGQSVYKTTDGEERRYYCILLRKPNTGQNSEKQM